APGPARGVDSAGPLYLGHDAAGRLVVRVRGRVDVGIAAQLGVRSGRRLDHARLVEVGSARSRGRELGRELAEAQVLAAPLDQPEDGRVPEHRCAADAEEHLVAVGELEQVGDSRAYAPDDRLHALATVARP